MSLLKSNVHLPFKIEKPGSRRVRTSNFLITMNTNIRFDPEEAHTYAPKLYELADGLFGSDENIRRYVKFLDGGDWSMIESMELTSKVEIGRNSRGSRLHLHVGLKIRHHSKIHLDPDHLIFDANTMLPDLDFPFPIQNIHISAHKADIMDYLMK